jgi:hypothetical protein
MTTFLFLLFFVLSLSILVLIRTKSNGKYEVKITDTVICLIPIVIWLVTTGQISELGIGDLKFKLKETYKKPVATQISYLIENEDLILIGVDCKYGWEDEIVSDTTFPSYKPFKFLLIKENCEDDQFGNSNPTFWGILAVEDYKQLFLSPDSKLNGELFIGWVKSQNLNELEKTIPSFISLDNAIDSKTSKLFALEQMEKLKTNFLPVVDEKKQFIGMVYRDRINSSFLIDIGKILN